MNKPEYRYSAQQHVRAAKLLLTHQGEGWSRHACLELRMAIEALTYLNLQAYLAEVSNETMKAWTPKQVISELLAVDPTADKSVHISVGIEKEYGVPSTDMTYVGEDKRLTVKWANKAHNALGNFLHEPTIRAYEQGKHISDDVIRAKATEIIAELDEILSARIWGVNFGRFVEVECRCGFKIKRKMEILKDGTVVCCANCAMGYKVTIEPNDMYRFAPDQIQYRCEGCGTDRVVDMHRLHSLPFVKCSCGHLSKVVQLYQLEPWKEAAEPDQLMVPKLHADDPKLGKNSVTKVPICSRIVGALKCLVRGY